MPSFIQLAAPFAAEHLAIVLTRHLPANILLEMNENGARIRPESFDFEAQEQGLERILSDDELARKEELKRARKR